jgi:hypothetical protein
MGILGKPTLSPQKEKRRGRHPYQNTHPHTHKGKGMMHSNQLIQGRIVQFLSVVKG